MRKFKLDKEMSLKIAALFVTGAISITSFASCSKKDDNNSSSETYSEYSEYEEVSTTVSEPSEEEIYTEEVKLMVNDVNSKLNTLLPNALDDVKYNTALMLLLDVFTQPDENGKIDSKLISNFKSRLDVDNMIYDFNTYLDMLQQKAIKEGKLEHVSTVLPSELSSDKSILSNIETIVENIIKYSDEKDKNKVLEEFNKIYSLVVLEKQIDINGFKIDARDLSFPSRAVLNNLAEIAAYYSRNYISKEQYDKIDKRSNDQNNKAYIRQDLEILANNIVGTSLVDVDKLFSDKYEEVTSILNGKVNLSKETIKNLVNYLNMKYLTSDKVSDIDMIKVIGEYNEQDVNDVILAIDAISSYNASNSTKVITFSSFLVENYVNTDTGKIDKLSLDFIQFNSFKLINTTSSSIDYDTLSLNPYFENIKKFFKGDDFTHVNNNVSTDIAHSLVSDGVKFISNEVVLYTLGRLPKVTNMDNYLEISEGNLRDSIQYIQNIMTGECKRIDGSTYTLTK